MCDMFMAFPGVLIWSWYCHDIAWSSRINILMIMWMTCAFGFLVVIMILFMMVSGDILEYYFGYHAAFGLLVVSMIIFHDASWCSVAWSIIFRDDVYMWILAK